MKFVDVKNDVAFHKIFGNANRTVSLISFLNAVLGLEGTSRVAEVQIENPYLFPVAHGGKTVIIDVRATDQLGRKFIVEMQVADIEGFTKRTQFYASQIARGEQYKELRPTHFIGILDFVATENPHYYSHHVTMDTVTGQRLLKDIQYFFIELPKFDKKLDELTTMIDRWVYFIKNAENLTIMPSDILDEGLQSAYEEAAKHNWSLPEMNAYFDAGAREADYQNAKEKAERLALEKGVKMGMEQGIEKGIEKGEEKKAQELIVSMFAAGLPVAQIALITQKTEADIAAILADNDNSNR